MLLRGIWDGKAAVAIGAILLLTKLLVIWFLSIFRIFGYQENYWVFVVGFIFELVDVGAKIIEMVEWSKNDRTNGK